MIYDDVAEALLAAAGVSSGVTGLARSVVAPGPLAAKDCRMVVVWGDGPRQQNRDSRANISTGLFSDCCAGVSVWRYTVRFVADCVPAFDDQGAPPPAADITAWTVAYMADVQRVNDALFATDLSALGYDCSNLLIGEGTPGGPDGQVAWTDWAVQFSPA